MGRCCDSCYSAAVVDVGVVVVADSLAEVVAVVLRVG